MDATFDKYCTTAVRLLAYLIREHIENTDPAFVLPAPVSAAVEALIPSIVEPDYSTQDRIHAVFLLLFTTVWVRTGGHSLPDPTIRLLAALMARDEHGNMAPPGLVTPVISHLEYIIRLVLMHEMHQDHNGVDQMLAFEKVRPFLIEDAPSTFGDIRSIKHLASGLNQATPLPAAVYFPHHSSRDELIFRGQHLFFQDLKTLIATVEKDIIKLALQLCLGHDLEPEHGVLHDDLRATTTGYSVFTEIRNTTFNPKTSIRKFLSLPGVFEHFYIKLPSGNVVLRTGSARSWLHGAERLDLLVMAAAHLTGGGLGRGTEVTRMRVRSYLRRILAQTDVFLPVP